MTAEAIVQDIKLLLGGSVVAIELTDEELLRLVKMAFSFIAPYVGTTKHLTKAYAPVIDLSKDGVTEVLRIWRSDSIMARDGSELLFDFQKFRRVRGVLELTERQLINRYAIDDIFIPFEFINGKLYISEGVATGTITVECMTDLTMEDIPQNGRVGVWLTRFALALAKEAIGRIRGKFTSDTLPVKLDADKLLQEASSEKQTLLEELSNNNWGPIFVLR